MRGAPDLAGHLDGVLCATVTPFVGPTAVDVDWDGVRFNVEWLLDRGIRVLIVNGSIAECSSLTAAERHEAVRCTVEAAAGRAVVVAGCSATSITETVGHCRLAATVGADGVMLLPPYYFALAGDEIVSFFTSVARDIELPFIVYNNPATAGYDIPLHAIEQIAALPGFAALKDATSDVLRFYGLVKAYGDRFPVIAANESVLLFTLIAGATACMTASAAFAPELLRSHVDAARVGDAARVRGEFARLHAFRELMQPELRAGRPAYIAYTKAAIDLVGGRGGSLRPPLSGLTDDQIVRLRDVIGPTGPMALTLA